MKHTRAHPFYARQIWRNPVTGIRAAKLRRDPMCEVSGCHSAATTVDHRIGFMQGKDDAERWYLFCGGLDFSNLRSCCQPHHDNKPLEAEKRGAREHNPLAATGDAGRQFTSAVSTAQIDRACAFDVDELLNGIDIPE